MKTTIINNIAFTGINNCKFGNPRYVFHYLNIDLDYEKALKIAKKIGGKKFNNKKYSGGIVIASYNLQVEADYINANNKFINN